MQDLHKDIHILIVIKHTLHERTSLPVKGMGTAGKGGGEPGDLYLKIHVRQPLVQKIRDFLRV